MNEAATGATELEGGAGGDVPLRTVRIRPLLRIAVAVGDIVEISAGRRLVPLTGGTFVGRDDLRGVVLPGGSDWQYVRPDGSVDIEAHYALRTHDGRGIEVHSSGVRHVSPDIVERMAAGEQVDPDDYYFRTHIRLETTEPSLAHLNHRIGLATGQRDLDLVHIHIHEVL